MKSDCTHRLNKGEATKGDIALSLSRVMADSAMEASRASDTTTPDYSEGYSAGGDAEEEVPAVR